LAQIFKIAISVLIYLIATLFAAGVLLAVHIESDGFTRTASSENPQYWYLATLALILSASVAVPLLHTVRLFPSHTKSILLVGSFLLVAALSIFLLLI